MATSSSPGGTFLTSRSNIVGLIVAVLVVILHIAFGLGVLWPLVAVAGWGAAVALVPDRAEETPQLTGPPPHESPSMLLRTLSSAVSRLHSAAPPEDLAQKMRELDGNLGWILREWDELDHVPETRLSLVDLITNIIPELVDAFLEVPERNHPAAVAGLTRSLDLINREAMSTRQAIIDKNVRALENQTHALYLRLGQVPGIDSSLPQEPIPGDENNGQPSDGYDRQP